MMNNEVTKEQSFGQEMLFSDGEVLAQLLCFLVVNPTSATQGWKVQRQMMNHEVTKEQSFRWQMPRSASGPEKSGLVTLFLCCSIHWAGMMNHEVTKEQSFGLEMLDRKR